MKNLLQFRKKIVVNIDPLRRCYDGCHFSSVEQWTDWQDICSYSSLADAEDSAATFKRINGDARDYRILQN